MTISFTSVKVLKTNIPSESFDNEYRVARKKYMSYNPFAHVFSENFKDLYIAKWKDASYLNRLSKLINESLTSKNMSYSHPLTESLTKAYTEACKVLIKK